MRPETRDQDRIAVIWLGVAALIGLGALAWQQRHPPIVLSREVSVEQAAAWNSRLEVARRIDINTAGVAELECLPGVGPALASRIVADRQAHGSFRSLEELSRVPGIGPKTSEALQTYVAIGGESDGQSWHR